jgi:hypothetical protein
MTSLDHPTANVVSAELVEVLPPTRWQQFEELLGRASDYLNPILVKEARQALRSRQFTATFFVMLASGWMWSILGLALLGPSAYYGATGPSMFYWYFVILAAPLIIAIPYYAYQSLSSERQDRTYELVSITALDASGILIGKLGGIVMQMVVYLSALFPCLAFTYLLRGLDIFSVMLVVLYTCLLSLGLAMIGLLLATLAPTRGRQIVQGVVFAVLLFWVFITTISFMGTLVYTAAIAIGDREFWTVNFSLALLYANAFTITFLSARATLTTASQNRSTALRLALVVAQLSAVAWFGWSATRFDGDMIYGLIFLSTVVWYGSGILLVGESGKLSPRVRRGLPQSWLGRVVLAWLVPGSGSGYMFVITNMLMLTLVATLFSMPIVVLIAKSLGGIPVSASNNSNGDAYRVLEACIVATSYIAIYLGLARLIFSAARRVDEVKLSFRILIGLVLIIIGGGGPWVLQLSAMPDRSHYSALQITNPVWTLWEYCVRSGPPAGTSVWPVTMLPLAALLIWGLNLPSLARETLQTHQANPKRIEEEDAEIFAARMAPQGPASPWD